MSESRISSSLSTIIPSTSVSLTRRSNRFSRYSLELSSSVIVLMNFTRSNTAAIASAVLKSSSIALSKFPTYSADFANFSASVSAISSLFALPIRNFRRSAAVMILSSPLFAASINSALKFSGLL